jgi:hypothetical protein
MGKDRTRQGGENPKFVLRTNVTDKVTKEARLEKKALLRFLTQKVSSERSFPRKASSEKRTFVTNKIGNLAFAPGLTP